MKIYIGLLAFFLSLFLFIGANAQMTRGSWLLGGGIQINSQDNSAAGARQSYREFNLRPSGYHFLSNAFAVGGDLEYQFIRLSSGNSINSAWFNQHTLDFQPALRYYYFNPPEEPLKAFFQIQGQYGRISSNGNALIEDAPSVTDLGVNAGGGLNYLLGGNVVLEALLMYRYSERTVRFPGPGNRSFGQSNQVFSFELYPRYLLSASSDVLVDPEQMQLARNVILGGQVIVEKGTNDIFRLNLNPRVAFFVLDRFAMGSSGLYERFNDGFDDSIQWEVSPFARLYFYPWETWQVFPQVNYGFRKSTTDIGTPEEMTTRWRYWRLGGGASTFLAPNVALEIILSYAFQDFSTDDSPFIPGNQNNVISLDIGLQYYLTKFNP